MCRCVRRDVFSFSSCSFQCVPEEEEQPVMSELDGKVYYRGASHHEQGKKTFSIHALRLMMMSAKDTRAAAAAEEEEERRERGG